MTRRLSCHWRPGWINPGFRISLEFCYFCILARLYFVFCLFVLCVFVFVIFAFLHFVFLHFWIVLSFLHFFCFVLLEIVLSSRTRLNKPNHHRQREDGGHTRKMKIELTCPTFILFPRSDFLNAATPGKMILMIMLTKQSEQSRHPVKWWRLFHFCLSPTLLTMSFYFSFSSTQAAKKHVTKMKDLWKPFPQ